jgi:hypothetical protein
VDVARTRNSLIPKKSSLFPEILSLLICVRNFAKSRWGAGISLSALGVSGPDIPDPRSPMGARGIGEIGITGVAAAIANAVFNATGKRVRDLPLTLDKLLSI